MDAFFLPTDSGARFCIHHRPPDHADRAAAVVFAPAFAEEMNKSRHVVAQTARRLAAMGVGVLLIDPLGCGDSSGGFEDASWAAWRDDIHLGAQWLAKQGYRRLWVWGMRLGALLAAECAADPQSPFERCVLWQPVASGEAHLTQFLRLRTAGAMISDSTSGETVKQLRARLNAGDQLEVAGYGLSSRLAMDIEARRLAQSAPACRVNWFEVVPAGGEQGQVPLVANRVLTQWRDQGVQADVLVVEGDSFWSATSAAELIQCPSLVDATAQAARAWL